MADNQQIDISSILIDPDVPKLYVNGFIVGSTSNDMFIITQCATNTIGMILLSFTTAKTLAEDLTGMVKTFEEQTGQQLLTMRDIQSKQLKTI
jgi:hypothetical protein